MADIIVDTNKLNQYAQRIDKVNNRITRLDQRMNTLYTKVGLPGLFNLIKADVLTGYSLRLSRCKDYFEQTASDFEKTERTLININPCDFTFLDAVCFDGCTTAPMYNSPFNGEKLDEGVVVELFKSIGSSGLDALKEEIARIPEDIKSVGETLSTLEKYYKKAPHVITHALDVLFLPESLKESYTITSGLLQGDLTFGEVWDIAKSISTKKTKLALLLETFDYTFTVAPDLDKEMQDEILKQIKEGDIIGALGDATEGFIDGIVGGSILIMGNVGGRSVDVFLEEVPGAEWINKGMEYVSGAIGMNGGKGYSIGGLVSKSGEQIFKGVDAVTDFATDKLNDVTDFAIDSLKGGIEWAKGIFS